MVITLKLTVRFRLSSNVSFLMLAPHEFLHWILLGWNGSSCMDPNQWRLCRRICGGAPVAKLASKIASATTSVKSENKQIITNGFSIIEFRYFECLKK